MKEIEGGKLHEDIDESDRDGENGQGDHERGKRLIHWGKQAIQKSGEEQQQDVLLCPPAPRCLGLMPSYLSA